MIPGKKTISYHNDANSLVIKFTLSASKSSFEDILNFSKKCPIKKFPVYTFIPPENGAIVVIGAIDVTSVVGVMACYYSEEEVVGATQRFNQVVNDFIARNIESIKDVVPVVVFFNKNTSEDVDSKSSSNTDKFGTYGVVNYE